jgi:hypothetical protein
MIIYSILWYLSWPLLILASYFIIGWVVKKIEKRWSG